MNTAVSLDSFQLIVGAYLIYVAIKGSGTLYNFFDLSEDDQIRVNKPLRIIYAVCGVIALSEAGLCMWQGSSDLGINVSIISTIMTILIVLILIGVFVWLRKLAKSNTKK